MDEAEHKGPLLAGKPVLKGQLTSSLSFYPALSIPNAHPFPCLNRKLNSGKKHEMSHKLLSGRNDPGAEATSSLEESILEVVMDLEPCEPQVWAPLYERQRDALPCLNTVFRQFEAGHKCWQTAHTE